MRRSGAGRFRGAVLGCGAVLGLRRRGFPFLDLCVVMPNHATDRRACHRMMTRHVTHNAPNRGTFDAAVSTTGDRKGGGRHRDGDSEQRLAHVDCRYDARAGILAGSQAPSADIRATYTGFDRDIGQLAVERHAAKPAIKTAAPKTIE